MTLSVEVLIILRTIVYFNTGNINFNIYMYSINTSVYWSRSELIVICLKYRVTY